MIFRDDLIQIPSNAVLGVVVQVDLLSRSASERELECNLLKSGTFRKLALPIGCFARFVTIPKRKKVVAVQPNSGEPPGLMLQSFLLVHSSPN